MAYKKTSTYVSNPVDEHGIANYSDEENRIWQDLIVRQIPLVKNRGIKITHSPPRQA